EPVASLTAQQAIGQCQLRRNGDLACTYRNTVFLYLFECHPDIAPYALEQVFRLPFRRLFADWRTHTDTQDIRQHIGPLRNAAACDGASPPPPVSEPHQPALRLNPVRQPLLN